MCHVDVEHEDVAWFDHRAFEDIRFIDPLDEIAGVGANRKRALLQHFGSAKAVAGASLTDLASVGGVSETLAKKIFDFFHPGG